MISDSAITLIDSHCHLDFPCFSDQLEKVLARAAELGVSQFIIPGVTMQAWQHQLAVVSSFDAMFAAVGLHPCFMSHHRPEHLDELTKILQQREDIVAVGEIGLDLWHGRTDYQQQFDLFKQQLWLAKDYDKPVILHVRKAHDEVLGLLRKVKLEKGGVVHAFSGSEQQAMAYISLGFKLGFGGAISYERAIKLRRLARVLPLAALVLETDSPDMPFNGFQGQDNEPYHLIKAAQLLAELQQVTLAEVGQVTSANVQRLFSI